MWILLSFRVQDIASQCIGVQVTSSPSQALLLFNDQGLHHTYPFF